MKSPQQRESIERLAPGVQKSSYRRIALDERIKRMIKQHPQRDIPQVESVEPSEALARE